jgi:hypothetical protein
LASRCGKRIVAVVTADRDRDRLLGNLPNLAQGVIRRAAGGVVVDGALIVAQHLNLRADQQGKHDDR